MGYEVELKFRLDGFQLVEAALRTLGAVERSVVSQVDRYFNHPARDFRSTDEAFRIRSAADCNWITYKGAVIGNIAKTRHEIEVKFADGSDAVERLVEIVSCLGFRFVREVRKTRRSFTLIRYDRNFELAMDELPELGCFLEIELLVEDDDRQAAESAVWELARLLGLTNPERRSYLDQLVELDALT